MASSNDGDEASSVAAVETEDEEESYAVEKIVKVRGARESDWQYFVKWEGYNESDNSWVAAVDVGLETIDAFEQTAPAKWRRKAALPRPSKAAKKVTPTHPKPSDTGPATGLTPKKKMPRVSKTAPKPKSKPAALNSGGNAKAAPPSDTVADDPVSSEEEEPLSFRLDAALLDQIASGDELENDEDFNPSNEDEEEDMIVEEDKNKVHNLSPFILCCCTLDIRCCRRTSSK